MYINYFIFYVHFSNIETTDTNGISSGDHENENRQQSVVDISLANENNRLV